MSWDSLLNQTRAINILSASIRSGRVAHAYLFTGPEGVGKFAAALELARAVNCDHPDGGPCGACGNCSRIAALQHPDVHLVFALPVGKNEKAGDSPLAKLSDDEIGLVREQVRLKAANPYHRIVLPRANAIKISSMREVRKESSLGTFGNGRKVFIVIDADMMNDESSNALLKTLEEPASDLLIILLTSRPESLLATIISRCQQIRFDALREEAIADALVAREGIEPSQAAAVASLANGNYTRALEYLRADLAGRRAEAVNFVRTALGRSGGELLDEIDRITTEYEKSEIEDLIRLIVSWLRQAVRVAEHVGGPAAGGDDSAARFARRYEGLEYARVFEALDRAISLLDKNVYIPLILIDLAVQLRRLISAKTGADAPVR